MSVIKHGNIGFGTRSGAAFIDYDRRPKSAAKGGSSGTNPDAPAETAKVDEAPEAGSQPWSKWGSNNLAPQEMVADIEQCGVLDSGIDGKARFGMGTGIRPVKVIGYNPDKSENIEMVQDDEIEAFLFASDDFNQCYGMFRDMIGLRKMDASLILSNDLTKIAAFQREDPCHVRLEKFAESGRVENVYVSRQFEKVSSYDPKEKKVVMFPLLPQLDPAGWLLQQKEDNNLQSKYFYTSFYPSWNKRYYPRPIWMSALEWVRIAQGVPKMKAVMFENNVRLKYIVVIHESYWTRNYVSWNDPTVYTDEAKEKKKNQLYDDIEEYLVGTANAYKTVFVDGYVDPVTKVKVQDIEIKPIEDSTKNGELLPDSAAANSEILFALMMNPALMGADMPGGPYSGGAGSGSNIREAALVQVMIQEFERRQISRLLNIVAAFNGWNTRHKNLQWRFPGLVLTTKDTGSNAKPVM